jgi:hypothetical protein
VTALPVRPAARRRRPRSPRCRAGTNRHGQQLFLAHTFQDRRVHLSPDSTADAEPLPQFAVTGDHEQLVLFGMRRSTAGQGLKSICRLLKGRKVLFADPTARVKIGYHEAEQPRLHLGSTSRP